VLVTPLLLLHAGDYLAAAQAVPPAKLVLVLGIGLFATVGHLCLIFAFGHAPMATLMPFIYTQMAFALGVSYLVFRHVPDGWAWVGMAVIAACGAVSAWLNARQTSAQRPASIVAVDTAYD
jgi:drug/metabolite transporter (DMT)-like permease